MPFRAGNTRTISPRLIKAGALHKLTTGRLWFLSWFGRDGRVERRSGCARTSLSVRAKMKLGTTNTQTWHEQRFFGVHTTQSGLNAGVRFPSATWNFPHGWIPQSHCCHCLPVNSECTPRKTKPGRAALMMRHAEVVLALVAGWPSALWLYAVLTAARKWKQQVAEWNGLNSHDIFYTSTDEDRMEKNLISLSDWAHKNIWIYCLFLILPYPLVFPWKVSDKCYEAAAAVCNVETTSHQGLCDFHAFSCVL